MKNYVGREGAPGAFAVTPSDATVIRTITGVWVGGAGNLVVEMLNGASATFTAVPAGTLVPIQVRKVMAATTATNIVGLL